MSPRLRSTSEADIRMATTLPPPVTCSVIEQRVGDTLAVQGRIAVREAADGRYAMKVRKVSRSGTT